MVLGGVLLKIVANKHIIIESHIRHTGNVTEVTVTEMAFQTCISLWLRQKATPGGTFKLTCYGSILFLHYCEKCQKLYKLNEFYSVTEIMLIKGTFLLNQEFLVFYSNF